MAVESGGAAPGRTARVQLYTRADCHLCDVARAELAPLAAEYAAEVDEIDVDTDPEMRAEYGDRVPVVVVDGREVGYFTVPAAALRAALG